PPLVFGPVARLRGEVSIRVTDPVGDEEFRHRPPGRAARLAPALAVPGMPRPPAAGANRRDGQHLGDLAPGWGLVECDRTAAGLAERRGIAVEHGVALLRSIVGSARRSRRVVCWPTFRRLQ